MLAAQSQRSVKTFLYKQVVKHLYSRADGFVSPSQDLMASITPYMTSPASKRHVIYNPTVTDKFHELSVRPCLHPWCEDDTKHKLIVAVGTLKIRKKGLDILLQAFHRVHAEDPDTRLLLVGNGPDRQAVETMIANLDLTDAVQLTGFQDNPFPYMKAADVYVLPSRWEGLPNTLIQAVACGTTSVAANCPSGPREILEDGAYGYLVPPDNDNELAKALIHALDHPLDSNTLKERTTLFAEQHILHQYDQLFKNILTVTD